jgi:hypothetical protein
MTASSDLDDIIVQLNELDSVDAKERYLLEGHPEFIKLLAELFKDDVQEYHTCYNRILDSFLKVRGKAAFKKTLDLLIDAEIRKEYKTKLEEFSGVDINNLALNKSGPFPTQDNFYKILLAAKRVKPIHDEMTANVHYTMIDWDTTEPIFELPGLSQKYHRHNDYHNIELQRRLNQTCFPSEHNWSALKPALQNVAKQNKVDFYQMWMSQYRGTWDGIDRINNVDNCFAVKYLVAAKEQWSCSWARLLMMCLVWRCFSPGCHQRYYFVFEGDENIGKSHLCRILVPECWYRSSSISAREDIEHYYKHTYDKAVIEFAELGGTDRVSVNLFKRVTTETHSTFRRLYGDDVYDYPKRNITILTTNENVYLRNTTGNTRPVIIKSRLEKNELIDIEGFKAEYPQILAQAIHMYDAGVDCYLNENELKTQNEHADERDVVFDTPEWQVVVDYFSDPNLLEIAKENFMYLDLLYTKAITDWEATKPVVMKSSRAFGQALERFGFEKRSKPDHQRHIPGEGTRKVWWWKKDR